MVADEHERRDSRPLICRFPVRCQADDSDPQKHTYRFAKVTGRSLTNFHDDVKLRVPSYTHTKDSLHGIRTLETLHVRQQNLTPT
jgi:hypothetical protein